MNELLLNEHRMLNEFAKEYAKKHLTRDYEAMKPPINQFMQVGMIYHTRTDKLYCLIDMAQT
jgi:hypothetical protein